MPPHMWALLLCCILLKASFDRTKQLFAHAIKSVIYVVLTASISITASMFAGVLITFRCAPLIRNCLQYSYSPLVVGYCTRQQPDLPERS